MTIQPLVLGGAMLVAVLAGCASPRAQATATPTAATPSASATPASFTTPFAYCASVGTIDAPDARYTGPKMPDSVARGLQKAMNIPPTAPLTPILQNSFWRCMDGQVYACTIGANLPCQTKADTSRTPNTGMVNFCRDRPDSEVIPAVATGRATVYLWRCNGTTPEIVRQVTEPDARGFLANIWYRIGEDSART